MQGLSRRIPVALLLLAGCPDDSGGEGETDGSTSDVTMSGPTSAASMSSTSSSTTASTTATSTETGEESSSGVPDTTSGSASESSSSGLAVPCESMSFFATSVGSGRDGGNLGGLDGADATCQGLAEAAGSTCTWHAYLSSSTEDARDRIGTGPWINFAGDIIAADVDALHTDGLSNGDPQHVLDESGAEVPGDEHDILTGSQEDGTLLADTTCDDWTSNTSDFVARVGHSDIPGNPMFSPSWNSAHDTPGCAPADLDGVGGAGRLYCFAID